MKFVFASDNGGPLYPGAANKNLPLRGGKLTLFDGGMRVNAFVYSAGLLPSAGGRVERGLMHITDLLPVPTAVSLTLLMCAAYLRM